MRPPYFFAGALQKGTDVSRKDKALNFFEGPATKIDGHCFALRLNFILEIYAEGGKPSKAINKPETNTTRANDCGKYTFHPNRIN